MNHYRDKSKVRFHKKVAGQPFGVYTWGRGNSGGIVFRVGAIGHFQLQHYRGRLVGKKKDGRRGKHGVSASFWGVAGRRRKRVIEFSVHL